ncbi:MAG: DUF3800 domain-containing protein [Candidatus Saccharibacteria bacterium]|nr:DUF3800 domain-containing protein [Candidatus Saccharibacteria bacterium]
MNLFFIDDSGSKQWDTPHAESFIVKPPARTEQNRKYWESNYFVLAGIHVDSRLVAKLNQEIRQKKKEVFGNGQVEIKSYYLRNPEARKRQYLRKYDLTPKDLKSFVDTFWYKLLEDNKENIQIQAVVLDKRYYSEQRHRHSPLDIATVALLDRIEKHPKKQCRIIFDQMESSIRSTKGDQGRILQIADKSINLDSRRDGSYSHIDVKFGKSSSSNFLQLADIVAYDIRGQFVDFGDQQTTKPLRFLKYYPYFEGMMGNFYCNSKNSGIQGDGLVKLPNPPKFIKSN